MILTTMQCVNKCTKTVSVINFSFKVGRKTYLTII